MNLRFVEAFRRADRLKRVTRAAEKLFVTQRALSSCIAALAFDPGMRLRDRRDRPFRLTTAGACFQRHAGRMRKALVVHPKAFDLLNKPQQAAVLKAAADAEARVPAGPRTASTCRSGPQRA